MPGTEDRVHAVDPIITKPIADPTPIPSSAKHIASSALVQARKPRTAIPRYCDTAILRYCDTAIHPSFPSQQHLLAGTINFPVPVTYIAATHAPRTACGAPRPPLSEPSPHAAHGLHALVRPRTQVSARRDAAEEALLRRAAAVQRPTTASRLAGLT